MSHPGDWLDWSVVADSLPAYAKGLVVTLALLAASLGTGFAASLALAIARVSPRRRWRWPVGAFTFVFRGTPLLVQLFIVYFGLAQFVAVRESVAWPLLREAWFCAWLVFALNTTAYTTEIFAGALRATPHGEVEAARAIGMGRAAQYRHVLLPGALRRALPQYGNEVVGLLHATAVVGAISLVDLTRVARDVYATSLLPVESFGTVGLVYFALTFVLVAAVRLAERRWHAHLRPARAAGTGVRRAA